MKKTTIKKHKTKILCIKCLVFYLDGLISFIIGWGVTNITNKQTPDILQVLQVQVNFMFPAVMHKANTHVAGLETHI